MKRATLLLGAAALVTAGLSTWALLGDKTEAQHQWVKKTDAQNQSYWTCVMHPQVHQDHPGNCPICGMQLVKASAPGDAGAPPDAAENSNTDAAIHIDPQFVQNFGIRTVTVAQGHTAQGFEAVGAVDIDERRIVALEARAAGWVERLQVRALGDAVQQGQSVAAIYSPELYAAQQELALAARAHDETLIAASRQRLLLLGVSGAQITALLKGGEAQRRVAIVAPQNGVITELNVREGQQLTPGTALMRIADLSRVWITIEVPDTEASQLHVGAAAVASLTALPGRTFPGTIEYVYPRVDAQTRTLRARLSLDNPDLALRPGMYARVRFTEATAKEALLIPSEAVIRTGERTVVIVAEGEGRFRPVLVTIGDDRGGQTEVLSGLSAGDTVVASGQFLIDSEASLRGVMARMRAPVQDATP